MPASIALSRVTPTTWWRSLGVSGGVFAGHSVSAVIGVLALLKAPEMFESLVLVGPSPRYIDDECYHGDAGEGAWRAD